MLQDKFKKILKKKGLKVTRQRILVLEALASHGDKHLSAEEIYEIVKASYPEIGLATVYRAIQLLLSLDLIESIRLEDGCVHYEFGKIGEDAHRHHHLICLDCGKVISFWDDMLDALESKIRDAASFQVVNHEVKLYGHCKECLTQQRGK